MALSAAAAGFLEALGVAPELPTPRFLEELFLRFSAAVPYETLTGRQNGGGAFEAADFFARAAEEQAPLVGGERSVAFGSLCGGLGFDVRHRRVRSRRGSHVACLVRFAGRDVLADPAWPLPILVPLQPPAFEIPTPYGALTARVEGGGAVVTADGRGREVELLRVEPGEASEGTESVAAPADLASPFALRLLPDRIHFWRNGVVTIADAWSRLAAPLPGSDVNALRALFALEGDLRPDLAEAASGPATMTVWHRVYGDRDAVRRRLERVELPAADQGIAALRFDVETLEDGLRLIAHATLAGEAPAILPESTRKALVFRLASDLFRAARTS